MTDASRKTPAAAPAPRPTGRPGSDSDPEVGHGFTGRELDIMSVLWRAGSGTVAEVRESLGDDAGYTTVLKLLQILEEKGAVTHEKEGRAHRYIPLVPRQNAGGRALKRALNKIFHGSAELLLATLVEGRAFSRSELERMRAILDEAVAREEEE